MTDRPGRSLAGNAAGASGGAAGPPGERGLRLVLAGMRHLTMLAAAFAAVAPSPAVAQRPAVEQPGPQRPVHLVLFNRPGPNFASLADLREEALRHRNTYLAWADIGEIVASGALEGEPVLGITVFRAGADERSIRLTLSRDLPVAAGVLDIEFRHWSIQMGALPEPSRPD